MERRIVYCLSLALLLVGLLFGGCKEKKNDEKAKTGGAMQARDEKRARRPGPAQVLPAPAPLPELKPGSEPQGFPKIVRVAPPPALKDALAQVVRDMSSESWRTRAKAKRALGKLIMEHKKDVQLARFLTTHPEKKIIIRSVRIWRGLKNHPHFVPVIVSLLGHSVDQVKAKALALLTYKVPKEKMAKVLPYVKKLLDHKSCAVRRKALTVLFSNRHKMKLDVKKNLLAGLKDPCPAVKALCLRHMGNVLRPEEVDEKQIAAVIENAKKSPYYLVRCAAMMALGGLKVKKAEKLIAKNLSTEATPSLSVYYADGKTPFTFSNHSSVPACAADALSALHGHRPKGKTVDRIAYWRRKMAKKGYSKKPPKNFCARRRDCKKGEEVCLEMQCVPYEKAVSAYWKYFALKHCEPKEKDVKWENFGSEAARQVGFGLHYMAHHAIRRYLQKKDPKKYKEKYNAIRQKPCPKKKK
jgi:HEAT repeat protein